MRLATIRTTGSRKPAVAAALSEGRWAQLPGVPNMRWAIQRQDEVARLLAEKTTRIFDSAELQFLPPVVRPPSFRDFYAFESHVANCRKKRGLEMPAQWYQQPVFYFSNPAGLVGHGDSVFAPAGCEQLDFELELGVIIGRAGKNIPPGRAWEHVAGFTIINDFSARDLQASEMTVGLGPAKGKDFATAVGPCLVTLDELRDRIDGKGKIDLEMTARLNGREISRGNSADMYFTWPQIIAHASRDARLRRGDLLGSGTVGTGCILELGPERTGGWLKPGDIIDLEIERLGVLRTPIVPRPSRDWQTAGSPSAKSEVSSWRSTT